MEHRSEGGAEAVMTSNVVRCGRCGGQHVGHGAGLRGDVTGLTGNVTGLAAT